MVAQLAGIVVTALAELEKWPARLLQVRWHRLGFVVHLTLYANLKPRP
jgi:hypothetical protein